MTKTVEAWAVVSGSGVLEFGACSSWARIFGERDAADDFARPKIDARVVPCTITYRLGDGDER